MSNEIVGYTVIARSGVLGFAWEPLCYGSDKEPSPELLLRRNRFQLFETEAAAYNALKATLDSSVSAGDKWPKQCEFMVKPVQAAIAKAGGSQ